MSNDILLVSYKFEYYIKFLNDVVIRTVFKDPTKCR